MVLALLAALALAEAPYPEAEVRGACDAGDDSACEALTWLLIMGEYGQDRVVDGARMAAKRCGPGEASQLCRAALLVYTEQGASEEELLPLLETSCAAGVSPTCRDLYHHHLRARKKRKAKKLLQPACEGGEVPWACGVLHKDIPLGLPTRPALAPEAETLLETSGLVFEMPAGFHLVPALDNPDMSYQWAMLADDAPVEVRYQVFDLAHFTEDKVACDQDPDCVMADPDQIFHSFFMANSFNVAEIDTFPSSQPFPGLGVRLEFRADEGLTTMTTIRESFSADKDAGFIYGLHRKGVAGATIVVLFPQSMDMDLAMVWLSQGFHALRFAEPVGLPGVEE